MTVKRIRRSKKWTLMKFGFLLYLLIGLFAVVWLRMAVVNIEYELGELNTQKVVLVRESKLLRAQRASFYSAEKIEDIAKKELGMNLSERDKIFFVKRTQEAGPYKVSMSSESKRASWK